MTGSVTVSAGADFAVYASPERKRVRSILGKRNPSLALRAQMMRLDCHAPPMTRVARPLNAGGGAGGGVPR